VRYSEIQQTQLATARYIQLQLDIVGYSGGYSGSAAKWLDIDRYRNTAGYQGYGEIQAGYR